MARWAIKAQKGTNNVQSICIVVAAASSPRRARVYDYTIGSSVTPADLAFAHICQRCTTAGTGTSLTPNALDQADSLASTIVCKDTVTADPTLTSGAFLGRKGLNQRNTYRWAAAPDGAIVIPATASNGIILGLGAATTTDFDAEVHFEEL